MGTLLHVINVVLNFSFLFMLRELLLVALMIVLQIRATVATLQCIVSFGLCKKLKSGQISKGASCRNELLTAIFEFEVNSLFVFFIVG